MPTNSKGKVYDLARELQEFLLSKVGIKVKQKELVPVLKGFGLLLASKARRGDRNIYIVAGDLVINPTVRRLAPSFKDPSKKIEVGGEKARIKFKPSPNFAKNANESIKDGGLGAAILPEDLKFLDDDDFYEVDEDLDTESTTTYVYDSETSHKEKESSAEITLVELDDLEGIEELEDLEE